LPYNIECFWERFWENRSKCFIKVDFNRVTGFYDFPHFYVFGKIIYFWERFWENLFVFGKMKRGVKYAKTKI
jgi:hypothetical protein